MLSCPAVTRTDPTVQGMAMLGIAWRVAGWSVTYAPFVLSGPRGDFALAVYGKRSLDVKATMCHI